MLHLNEERSNGDYSEFTHRANEERSNGDYSEFTHRANEERSNGDYSEFTHRANEERSNGDYSEFTHRANEERSNGDYSEFTHRANEERSNGDYSEFTHRANEERSNGDYSEFTHRANEERSNGDYSEFTHRANEERSNGDYSEFTHRFYNMSEIYLYNTMSREKELFTPIHEGKVGMYNCGPTVYSYIHIGNLRAFWLGDIIRRVFEINDYQVHQVMNITDIGHLVGDGDVGDDKMTKALVREGMALTLPNMLAIGEKYTQAFIEHITAMGVQAPHDLPRASAHIQENIDIVQELEKKGLVYTTSDGLYFETQKDPEYGKLRGHGHDHDDNHARIAENSEKKHPYDFALWKFDNEKGWASPWGQGFPGWHIECSGMAMKYLGRHFDIHTGGIDLIPVHHTNEMAQSCNAYDEAGINYWIHNEFVNLKNTKMSKSLGNVITMQTVIEKGYDPLAYRYFLLQAHYRTKVEFSWEILESAQTSYNRLRNMVATFEKKEVDITTNDYRIEMHKAFNDDLNTAEALGIFHKALKDGALSNSEKYSLAMWADRVFALNLEKEVEQKVIVMSQLPQEIQGILKKRQKARDAKDWKQSDELRDALQEKGYAVKDDKEKGQVVNSIQEK